MTKKLQKIIEDNFKDMTPRQEQLTTLSNKLKDGTHATSEAISQYQLDTIGSLIMFRLSDDQLNEINDIINR